MSDAETPDKWPPQSPCPHCGRRWHDSMRGLCLNSDWPNPLLRRRIYIFLLLRWAHIHYRVSYVGSHLTRRHTGVWCRGRTPCMNARHRRNTNLSRAPPTDRAHCPIPRL